MEPYYQDDHCTIYHGDSRIMSEWLSADVMVTDPPYGMQFVSGMQGAHSGESVRNDCDTQVRDFVRELWGDKPALIFGRWSVPHPRGSRMILTWEKGEHVGMGDLSLPWKPNTE